MYLGVKGSTSEIITGNGDGVWRTRTVRRRPEELRWRAEEIEKIKLRALLTGTTKQKHTPQYRHRMEKDMGELERVKNAKRRREEFLEKVTVPADGEVADEDSVKKTSKNYDIKIDDDEMTLDGELPAAASTNPSEREPSRKLMGRTPPSSPRRGSTRSTRRATWTWEPWR